MAESSKRNQYLATRQPTSSLDDELAHGPSLVNNLEILHVAHRAIGRRVGIISFCQFIPSLMSTVPFEVSEASTMLRHWRPPYGAAGHA
jgi:hypothetical protein